MMTIRNYSRVLAAIILAAVMVLGNAAGVSAATKPEVLHIVYDGAVCEETVEAKVSDSFTLKVKAEPVKASTSVSWSSSNKKYATVSSKGKVKCLKPGTVTIRCKSKYNKKVTASCTIHISKKPAKFEKSSYWLVPGASLNAIPTNTGKSKLNYSSSDESVATVSSKGVVKGVGCGTAVITVSPESGTVCEGSCEVTVRRLHSEDVRFIAHRGLNSSYPENSIAAFEAAGKLAFYGIESDVRVSTDGEFFLSHDDSLLRCTGVDKKLSECSSEELDSIRLLDPKDTMSDKSELRIPRMSEYLEICKDSGKVPIIEIKFTRTSKDDTSWKSKSAKLSDQNKKALSRMNEEIRAVMGSSRYYLISFNYPTVKYLKDLNKGRTNISYEYLYNGGGAVAAANFCKKQGIGFNCDYRKCSLSNLRKIAGKKIETNIYTVDDPVVTYNYIVNGAAMITTNYFNFE